MMKNQTKGISCLVKCNLSKVSIFSQNICSRFSSVWNNCKQSRVNGERSTSLQCNDADLENSPVQNEKQKRKPRLNYVPPRSNLQFKIGPPFALTTIQRFIYTESNNESVLPLINARIDRGFDLEDNEWVGYKRNYITLVAAFEFDDDNIIEREKFYYFDKSANKTNIDHFALNLISTYYENDEEVALVQHTAKRDRGPITKPKLHVAAPGILPSHNIIKQAANIRSNDKLGLYNKIFVFDYSPRQIQNSILSTYPKDKDIFKVAKYERIQFSVGYNERKATAVNHHFKIKIQLLGMANDRYKVLAFTETPKLIVRGRSPSNYRRGKNVKIQSSCEPQSITENTSIPKYDACGRLQRYNNPKHELKSVNVAEFCFKLTRLPVSSDENDVTIKCQPNAAIISKESGTITTAAPTNIFSLKKKNGKMEKPNSESHFSSNTLKPNHILKQNQENFASQVIESANEIEKVERNGDEVQNIQGIHSSLVSAKGSFFTNENEFSYDSIDEEFFKYDVNFTNKYSYTSDFNPSFEDSQIQDLTCNVTENFTENTYVDVDFPSFEEFTERYDSKKIIKKIHKRKKKTNRRKHIKGHQIALERVPMFDSNHTYEPGSSPYR